MYYKRTVGNILFNCFNYSLLVLIALVVLLPFLNIVACSFATTQEVLTKKFILFPAQFSLDAYKYVFSTQILLHSLFVTIFITVVGTAINMIGTVMMAYPLSHNDFYGRKVIIMGIIFTTMFSGGMIPDFFLVKSLGLLNSFWSIWLPIAINPLYVILIANFFKQLSPSLAESAKIDGCSTIGILFKIIIPLSLPAMASFSLFYAVVHWNSFFAAILYIDDANKWPVQLWLRQIVIQSSGAPGDTSQLERSFIMPPPQTIKMAVIVFATVPILLVYPFLQKYFTKGIMLGSVKG